MRKAVVYIAAIVLSVAASEARAQFDRNWKIFVVPFSHTDVGFTEPVPVVVEKQSAYIDTAIAYVERTASNPFESRFRWTIEITWPLEDYLATRSPAQIERLMGHVREGSIEIGAMHFSLQTDLAGPEELVRSLYFGREIGRTYGVDVRTAVTNDTPGATWSLAQLLNRAEIPYFSLAMNSFLSSFYETTDLPNLFYWEGQGGDRTLVWRSIHDQWAYLEGIVWGVYGAYGIMEQRLTNLLNSLAADGYPYDFVLINAATGDNGAPILSISSNVKEWNRRHPEHPMQVATFSQFFDHAASQSVQIPVYSGDAPNWWSWSFASSATGGFLRSRTAQVALPAAEVAASIGSALQPSYAYPQSDFRRAYINNLLFEDHNLGTASNVTAENVAFWDRKMGWVNAALDTARSIREAGLDAWAFVIGSRDPASVVVFNLTPWERTDVARISAEQLAQAGLGNFNVVDVETAELVPIQTLTSGDVVFLASGIPSYGFRRFRIAPNSGPSGITRLTRPVLENEFVRVEVDPASGGITSLFNKEMGVELATSSGHFAQYRLSGTGYPEVAVTESDSGSVQQRLLLTGAAPGSSAYRTEIVVPNHEQRVDITIGWDKEAPTVSENVDFIFNFALSDATLNYEIPFGNVRVFDDELSGFKSNHYGWLRWSEVSSPLLTAVLATTGTGVHAYSSGAFTGDVRLLTSFNNSGTAYRAGIGDLVTSFSVTTRAGGHDAAASTRFAYSFNHPLETRIIGAKQGFIEEPSYSFLRFEGADVLVSTLKRAEDGDGFIIRVFNPSDGAVETTMTFASEVKSVIETTLLEEDRHVRSLVAQSLPLALSPFEVVTLRLDLSVPSRAEPEVPKGESSMITSVYPNPTGAVATLHYQLKDPATVRIRVIDVLGRVVASIRPQHQTAGRHSVGWTLDDRVSSGVYLLALEAKSDRGSISTDAVTLNVTR